jgi:sec-independent protein translocase protein TatB
MFGVDTSELLIVAVLALLVIGPKELPGAMRTVGHWIGKVRGMARHFTSGIETMIREAELEEMEKRWREENERIMREFPTVIDAEPVPAAPYVADDQPQLPLTEAPPPLPPPPADYDPGGPEKKGEELP